MQKFTRIPSQCNNFPRTPFAHNVYDRKFVTAGNHANFAQNDVQKYSGATAQQRGRAVLRNGGPRCCAAGTLPPHSNTGGKSPTSAAFIDFLTFTFPRAAGALEGEEGAVLGVVLELERHTGLTLSSENPGGRNFYQRSWSLKTMAGGLAAGAFVAVGGNGDTVCVNLPGTSTALVRDWVAFRSWLEGIGAKITRVDLAHDCHDGQRTVDDAVEWYKSGQFAGQGRPPKCSQAGNWITPDDEEGRTFYVGKRENGKLFRAYEKGKQLGDAQSPWVRFEVELRSQDRTIPLDVLTRPGEYLAGAYPALSWVQQLQDKVKTWAKVTKITYDKLLREGRRAYGRLVNLMVDLGHTHQAIVEALQRSDGYPKSLESIPIVYGQGVAA